MSGRSLLGRQPVGAITIVETPVSQAYARRAQVAFVGVGIVSAVVATAVIGAFAPMLLAVVSGVLLGVVCGVVAGVLVRAWPVLRVLWWWSLEITVSVFVVIGTSALARATTPWLAVTVLLTLMVGCGMVGPVRRFLVAWSWCVVVRHRLRLCFSGIVRGGGGTRPGSLPLILWARPTPAGERVWLWLRPGLSVEDLEGKTGKVAVTCWASEVRVVRASTRYAALLRVDIGRRDPLIDEVASPLALLIPLRRNTSKPVAHAAPPAPPVGLELADIELPAVEPRGGRR